MTFPMGKGLKAIGEVCLVFAFTLIIVRLIVAYLPFQRIAGHDFLMYVAVLAVPLVSLALLRRDPGTYGIARPELRRDLKVVAIGIVPVVILSVLLFFIGWKRWEGALLISGIELVTLLVLAKLTEDRGDKSVKAAGAVLLLIPALSGALALDVAISFIYFFLLVGPAEEVLFRGYFQSRLNEAFGRPYRLFGISWGAGLVIASLIFGLWHVLNPFNPFIGSAGLAWEWGLWTFFLGLIFGIVRERTGSVAAPAILHGALNFF